MTQVRRATAAEVSADGRQQFVVAPGSRVADFLTSNRSVDVIEGPLGSGKTKALCVRPMRHAQEQAKSPIDGLRYTRFAMVRNTMPDLIRTTIRSWFELFPESRYGRYIGGAVKEHRIRFADVHCTVDFLSLDTDDDVRKLRSTEYTGICFNELQFFEKLLFDEARSRLRFPPQEHGGPTWRGVIADTNTPEEDHWLAVMTGRAELPSGLTEREALAWRWPDEWGYHVQPPALLEDLDQNGLVTGYRVNPTAENLANLPPGYYDEQMVAQSKAWIDNRLLCRVVTIAPGSPVWPMFRREFHVAREPLKPVPGHEVTVALDFGRVFPAALFAQEIGQRLYVQHEILGYNEPASVFAPRVKRFLVQTYPGCPFRLVGDPKGADIGQVTDRSAYDVFRDVFGAYVTPAPVKQNAIEDRTEAVAYALNDNPSGVNYLVISPACRILVVGMAGKYHLVREEDGQLRPKKDKYANLPDALQYLVLSRGVGRKMVGYSALADRKPVQTNPRWRDRPKTMRRVS